MNDSIFQTVFDYLQALLPEPWKKLVFYAGYPAGSYSMKFYVDSGNGYYIDCFNIPGLNKGQFVSTFVNINRVLSSERDKLPAPNRWNVFTMIVDSNGAMCTDFDYTNIDENAIDYERKWQEKYLR